MTHDEINKALHEARPGNLCWHTYLKSIYNCDKCKHASVKFDGDNLYYCEDLNAMAKVEAEFDKKQREWFKVNLGMELLDSKDFDFARITAPAHIRAKAALEVLTKK